MDSAPATPVSDRQVTAISKEKTASATAQNGNTRPSRTLDSVREQVAVGVAVRAISKAQDIDGVKVGVALTLSSKTDLELFLRHVVSKIKHSLILQQFVFVVAPAGPHNSKWPLIIVGSNHILVQKAATLACAKFLGRVRIHDTVANGTRWVAHITPENPSDPSDDLVLWDIVRKTPRILDPLVPPAGSRGISEILSAARTRLERLSPAQAYAELHSPHLNEPVVLVDIRPIAQRTEFGSIPDALVIERNVLEWRFDPRSDARLPIADRYDLRVIVFCQEGYTSSLAAASLHDLGLLNSTDVIGGFKAWKESGLPTDINNPTDVNVPVTPISPNWARDWLNSP
ncbi:rhodanese domain-containing protein [Rickenella mellea]|uniref:Rhodanese domain-containing protein n=1 Tax=Rickenella mellea TaxID=50990 RepID=A0A4Y7PNV2_9AGAM|nr:rhodanese domain-containing protein [Rickenella mellea]